MGISFTPYTFCPVYRLVSNLVRYVTGDPKTPHALWWLFDIVSTMLRVIRKPLIPCDDSSTLYQLTVSLGYFWLDEF